MINAFCNSQLSDGMEYKKYQQQQQQYNTETEKNKMQKKRSSDKSELKCSIVMERIITNRTVMKYKRCNGAGPTRWIENGSAKFYMRLDNDSITETES